MEQQQPKRIQLSSEFLLKSYIEVQRAPAALWNEMKEQPYNTIISSYYVKPVNFEQNPFQLPQQPYNKNANFQKGGYKKPFNPNHQQEGGFVQQADSNEGFKRHQQQQQYPQPSATGVIDQSQPLTRQQVDRTQVKPQSNHGSLEFEAQARVLNTQPDQEEEEDNEFEVVKDKIKKEKHAGQQHYHKPGYNPNKLQQQKQAQPQGVKQNKDKQAAQPKQTLKEQQAQIQKQTIDILPGDGDYASFDFGGKTKPKKEVEQHQAPAQEEVKINPPTAQVEAKITMQEVKQVQEEKKVQEKPQQQQKQQVQVEETKKAPVQKQQQPKTETQAPPQQQQKPKQKQAPQQQQQQAKVDFEFELPKDQVKQKAQTKAPAAQNSLSLDQIMQQQETDAQSKQKKVTKKTVNKDGINFDYIKPTQDEIFKNLPKQNNKPKVATSSTIYSNLEDLMKEQMRR
eukprot:403368909